MACRYCEDFCRRCLPTAEQVEATVRQRYADWAADDEGVPPCVCGGYHADVQEAIDHALEEREDQERAIERRAKREAEETRADWLRDCAKDERAVGGW